MSMSTVCHDGSTETQSGRVVQQLKGSHLSTTQLILRRGLTMFAAVSLLAVGLSVHFLMSWPQMLFSQANFTLDRINTTYTPDQIFSTVLVPNEESDWPWQCKTTTKFQFYVLDTNTGRFTGKILFSDFMKKLSHTSHLHINQLWRGVGCICRQQYF